MTPDKEAKRLRELCVDGEHTWEFCEDEIEIALRRAAEQAKRNCPSCEVELSLYCSHCQQEFEQ